MSQTAVEWLMNELYEKFEMRGDGALLNYLRNQALAMEKEQIIQSHCDGFNKSAEGWNGEYGLQDIKNIAEEINADEYYNETYQPKTT